MKIVPRNSIIEIGNSYKYVGQDRTYKIISDEITKDGEVWNYEGGWWDFKDALEQNIRGGTVIKVK